MPGMRATSSSVMLMIGRGLVWRSLSPRSLAELIWERRRRCLCRRPKTIKAIESNVKPTEPAMIAASTLRPIAIAYRAFLKAAKIKPSAEE